MADEITKDIQIHIHEHVGPLRERVGKLEGRLDVHDRELGLLRAGLDALRDRIDSAKAAMLDALDGHSEIERKRIDSLHDVSASVESKVDALRGWVIALGLGAGGVFAAFELMAKIGILRGP